jgi:DNA-binding protein HU-beta
MNKSELISKVAEKTGQTKKLSEEMVDATLAAITEDLAAGGKVQLLGFGSFEVKDRAARTVRNPKTGEPMDVAASKSASFKPGKALKDALGGK